MSEPVAPDAAPTKRQRLIFLGIWAAVFGSVLFAFRAVLLPFFLALVVAYVLEPVTTWLEGRKLVAGRVMPRWGAVVSVYVALLAVMALSLALGVPRLAVELRRLSAEVPEALAHAREQTLPQFERAMRRSMEDYESTDAPDESDTAEATGATEESEAWNEAAPDVALRVVPAEGAPGAFDILLPPDGVVVLPEGEGYRITPAPEGHGEAKDLSQTVMDALRGATEDTRETTVSVIRTAQRIVATVVKGIFTFFIMLMLSAYLLITRETIVGFFRSFILPERRERFDLLKQRVDHGLSGVVRGQLLICLVNGLLSGVGFYALGLKYWPLLTLVATVFSIIPIFGAILSSIPAVVIGLQAGVTTAVLVLLWIVIIHQIEANLLNPKIMGDAAHVHPVLVVFALLAGEHFFGIAGALLAVPVLSITQTLFLHWREEILGIPADRISEPVAAPTPAD